MRHCANNIKADYNTLICSLQLSYMQSLFPLTTTLGGQNGREYHVVFFFFF